ncbi:MAG: DNA alkylation repair protein [Nocardioides sp.]
MDPITIQVVAIKAALAEIGDPARASWQQSYMKSEMPFRGVTSPELKAVMRPFVAGFAPSSRRGWERAIRGLWDRAEYREDRYAALALARARGSREWLDIEALPLLRHLVVSGAWWDYVDVIAAHLVGDVLARQRSSATPILVGWSTEQDLWLRRTAVLAQLRHKADTDRDLLALVIENNLADGSFWLRKAIGWALREFARTDPEWVRAEVARHGDRLSRLSRREATKHCG